MLSTIAQSARHSRLPGLKQHNRIDNKPQCHSHNTLALVGTTDHLMMASLLPLAQQRLLQLQYGDQLHHHRQFVLPI